MQLPIEKLEIVSHRSVIGWFITGYKKIVHLLISPYLRNVFEKEHTILNNRFVEIERQADERHRQAELRLDNLENLWDKHLLPRLNEFERKTDERQRQAEIRLSQVEDLCKDLIKRMDSIAVILNKRQEDLDKRQEDLDKKLATLGYRFEYYINTGKIQIKE